MQRFEAHSTAVILLSHFNNRVGLHDEYNFAANCQHTSSQKSIPGTLNPMSMSLKLSREEMLNITSPKKFERRQLNELCDKKIPRRLIAKTYATTTRPVPMYGAEE